MQKITTFLTFNSQAEEAMQFYISIFYNSKVLGVIKYGGENAEVNAPILGATFQLAGQEFMAMNGGSYFNFAQGISLFINCETQDEIDEYWEKLSQGGEKQRCGWLKDKFGVSWQIVPNILGQMLSDKDIEKSKSVMDALLKMDKIDISILKKAFEKS